LAIHEGRAIAPDVSVKGRVLLLVGGMHGGWEANTVGLVNELIAHFETHPEDVLPGISLVDRRQTLMGCRAEGHRKGASTLTGSILTATGHAIGRRRRHGATSA
jgi:hypothetical protein